MIIKIILIYLFCGLVFYIIVKSNYKITKQTIPTWLVHIQLICAWFPILIFSCFNNDDSLFDRPIKDVIDTSPGIEMPGENDDKKM